MSSNIRERETLRKTVSITHIFYFKSCHKNHKKNCHKKCKLIIIDNSIHVVQKNNYYLLVS